MQKSNVYKLRNNYTLALEVAGSEHANVGE